MTHKGPNKTTITITDDGDEGKLAKVQVVFDPAPPTDLSGKTPYTAGVSLKMLESFCLWCLGHVEGIPFDLVEFPQIKNDDGSGPVVWTKASMTHRALHLGTEMMVEKQKKSSGGTTNDGSDLIH